MVTFSIVLLQHGSIDYPIEKDEGEGGYGGCQGI